LTKSDRRFALAVPIGVMLRNGRDLRAVVTNGLLSYWPRIVGRTSIAAQPARFCQPSGLIPQINLYLLFGIFSRAPSPEPKPRCGCRNSSSHQSHQGPGPQGTNAGNAPALAQP